MAQSRENYCKLLGLNPLKESTYNYADIEKKIDNKVTKWTKDSKNKENDPEMRFTADRNLSMENDMQKVFSNPELSKAEFKGALELLKAKATRIRKDSLILHDGTVVLLPGSIDKYIKSLHWDGITKTDLFYFEKVSEKKVPAVSSPVINAYKGLQAVQCFTIIEMLNSLIDNPELEINVRRLDDNASPTIIKEAFGKCEDRLNHIRMGVLSTQDTYIQSLRAVKLILTPSDMDPFLKYCNCNKILIPVFSRLDEDYATPFTRKYIDSVISDASQGKSIDRDMAVKILEDYCYKKKYIANFSSNSTDFIQCPSCHAYIENDNDVKCCTICGYSIKIACPSCRVTQPAGNKICKSCGFDFVRGEVKAADEEKKFRMNMRNGNLAEAKKNIDSIAAVFGTYVPLAAMKKQYREAEGDFHIILSKIESSYKNNKYYDVKHYCEDAELEYPGIWDNNYDLKKKKEDAFNRVSEAEKYCKQGSDSADEESKLALFTLAATACPDHPDVKAHLSEHPPMEPTNLVVTVKESYIRLKWVEPEDSKNVFYCIYRFENNITGITESTVPLDCIQGNVYHDRTVQSGIEYTYAIYSKRWDVKSSDCLKSEPVTLLLEVTKCVVEPTEGGLCLTYEKPPGCSRVRIWRKEGLRQAGVGDEVEVIHNGELVINDLGLRGDVKYFYLFVAEYDIKGHVTRSQGSVFSGTAIRVPDPVKNLAIRWNKTDGTYTAMWDSSKEDVKLYVSPKRLKIYGKTMKIEDVKAWMEEIQPLSVDDNAMTFSLPEGFVQFIYPVIPMGKMVVKGKELMVANLRPFRDVETKISGDYCNINMNWPPNVSSATIVVKNSGAPTGVDDPDAEKIHVTPEAYNKEKQIRIPMQNSNKRTVGIYAIYDIEGEQIASRGLVLDVFSGKSTKVRYNMKLERGDKYSSILKINIETNETVRGLPPISAIMVQSGIPLKRSDGEAIWRSVNPVSLNEGRMTITTKVPKDIDLSRVRLFMDNKNDYFIYKFIHPIYKGGKR